MIRIPGYRPESVEISGHMGELLQGRLGSEGPVALVTLPRREPVVRVSHIPCKAFGVHFQTGSPTAPVTQIAKLIRRTTKRFAVGRWIISPMASPGSGCGLSTASLLGVARLLGAQGPDPLATEITRIEGASDPLMFEAPERLLWASRQGRIVEALPRLPELDVVAGTIGPETRTDPSDENFADISDLVAPWKSACLARNHAEIGRLASLSAKRNTALRGKEPLEPLLAASHRFGAVGVAIAHTGSVQAMLFAPQSGDKMSATDFMRAQGYGKVCRFTAGG